MSDEYVSFPFTSGRTHLCKILKEMKLGGEDEASDKMRFSGQDESKTKLGLVEDKAREGEENLKTMLIFISVLTFFFFFFLHFSFPPFFLHISLNWFFFFFLNFQSATSTSFVPAVAYRRTVFFFL